MGVEVKKGTPLDNNEPLPKMTSLGSGFFSQILFDYRGFQDSRTTLATAPEAASTIETATHGFSIVTAADGQRAVQFIKTRDDGTTVTFQLCEGARGTPYSALAQYGNEKLKGATLKTHSEFKEMVDELFKAVKGLMVANGELQTGDEALKLAFKIVQEGVRREDGGSWVEFHTEDKDGGRAVSGRRVYGYDDDWFDFYIRYRCAFFGVSSPESK
jgi:hypothetical protein